MIDISRFPQPADAPEPGTCIRVERPEPGLAVLVLDPPHRPSLALLDLPLLRDLDLSLAGVEEDRELRGLVVTGRSPLSFAGGADIDAIAGVTDPWIAAEAARVGQRIFSRLEKLGRRRGGRLTTVAAVGGPVPGGACELSLACDCIVLADHPRTRIGLPEVKLGVLPAWGGTHRLPRRIGVPAAMAAILQGRLYPPYQARKLGLVDRLAKPETLARVAAGIAMGRERDPRRPRGWRVLVIDKNPIATSLVERQAQKTVMRETRGNYPAPLAVIPLISTACRVPLEQGFEREAETVGPISTGPVCKSLVRLFELSEAAKSLAKGPGGEPAPRVRRAGVIGAGVMGGAIASLLAEKGADVRLRDLDRKALDSAEREHQREIGRKTRRRRMERHDADAAIDRLLTTTEPAGFGRCELVVEAVAERLDVKRAVFAELAAAVPEDALLATNTSSLSVAEIAEGVPRPERVVGLHFFNPVRKMPLVEIVRGPSTSDEVLARAAKVALDLGKTPVVVKDVAGFLVNRLLGPYLDEALRLFEEGADPERVDRLLVDFGMPMGPFALLDEVGLDIATHAATSLHLAYGERMAPSGVLAPLVEAGDLGKKTGSGVFLYRREKGKLRREGTNGRLRRPPDGGARQHADEVVVDRAILALVNEAARCLEEAVVGSEEQLDLATVLGTGFAPFRGGPMRYADTRGREEIAERLAALADAPAIRSRPGGTEKFTPAPWLTRS